MMESYVGMIMLWGCPRIPEGWVSCQGQQLPIMQYQVLFAVLGLQYGGDGRTYFNVPDLRGRVPVGISDATNPTPNGLTVVGLSKTGGEQAVTLTPQQMPAHAHPIGGTLTGTTAAPLQLTASVPASAQLGTSDTPGNGNVPAKAPDFASQGMPDVKIYGASDGTTTLPVNIAGASGQPISLAVNGAATGVAGGNQAHDNMQPYIGLNYIICYNGIYPQFP